MSGQAKFSKRDFIIMAMGNIIGSGIFLASAQVIGIAGVMTPVAFLLGGLIMMMEVSFIIEMTIAHPVPGSFKVHAQEIFGDWWGFVIGWMFWTSGVLGMASEVTACAIFCLLWFSHVPLWIFSLIFSVLITILNINDLKGLSRIELGLASVKVATLLIFILAGLAIAAGITIGHASENLAVYRQVLENPLPKAAATLGSMLIILFAYTGTGIIGLAIVETKNPETVVPPAVRLVTMSVVTLYVLSTAIIVALLPLNQVLPDASPFVTVFAMFDIPFAGDLVNFILLTAALSALNSQVYSSSRMLYSLANDGQAPAIIRCHNKKGVPVCAVLMSGAVLLVTVMLSYVLPEKVFVYTVTASSFLALLNWLSISATHYFYRRKLMRESPEKLKYRSPCYPFLSWICFFSILAVIISAISYPDQVPGLYAGGIILGLISFAYLLIPKKKAES